MPAGAGARSGENQIPLPKTTHVDYTVAAFLRLPPAARFLPEKQREAMQAIPLHAL